MLRGPCFCGADSACLGAGRFSAESIIVIILIIVINISVIIFTIAIGFAVTFSATLATTRVDRPRLPSFLCRSGLHRAPCCQLIYWPRHPCPNHDHVHAANPSIGLPKPLSTHVSAQKHSFSCNFSCAYRHNGNTMLNKANGIGLARLFQQYSKPGWKDTFCRT